jgi:hypothetical protein
MPLIDYLISDSYFARIKLMLARGPVLYLKWTYSVTKKLVRATRYYAGAAFNKIRRNRDTELLILEK